MSASRCSSRLFAMVTLSASVAILARPVRGQIEYDSPKGRVEILGLRRWTLQMLKDSVQARRPGTKLYEAACMILLRQELGFADALVDEASYSSGPGTPFRNYLVIKVIEPGDRRRVQWIRANLDTFRLLRPGYSPVILSITDTVGNLGLGRFLASLQWYGSHKSDAAALASVPPAMRPDFERLSRFLDDHRSDRDMREALLTLRTDGAYANRLVAAAVLSNFSAVDSTWWALTDALRDPHEAVRSAAAVTLRGLPPRSLDWHPVAQSLRLLLGGTNVGATQQVLEMLSQTNVDPALAAPLLRGNGFWVLTHLGAGYPPASGAARALLIRLHAGHDLGSAKASWAQWIDSL